MTNIVATLEDCQVGRAALEVGEELCGRLGHVKFSGSSGHKQYSGAAVAHKQSSGVVGPHNTSSAAVTGPGPIRMFVQKELNNCGHAKISGVPLTMGTAERAWTGWKWLRNSSATMGTAEKAWPT